MKKLLLFLIFPFLFSCSSSTSVEPPEQNYPYTVGTWTVESPNMAEWNGTRGKSMASLSADTSIIAAPGQHSLTIVTNDQIVNGFDIQITDTSITRGLIFPAATRMTFPDSTFSGADNAGGHLGIDWNYKQGYMYMELSVRLNCDFEGDVNRIFLELRNAENTEAYRFYEFQTTGFLQAVKDVAGCIMP